MSENEQLMQIQRSDDRLEVHLQEITVVAGKSLMPSQKTRYQLDSQKSNKIIKVD